LPGKDRGLLWPKPITGQASFFMETGAKPRVRPDKESFDLLFALNFRSPWLQPNKVCAERPRISDGLEKERAANRGGLGENMGGFTGCSAPELDAPGVTNIARLPELLRRW
jgi:hypothetical protein